MKNAFNSTDARGFINRINRLTPLSEPRWGKMNVAQMLAHCNVTYELVYGNKQRKPNVLEQVVLKFFVKEKIVSEVPFPESAQTADVFIITEKRDFETEKKRLVTYLLKTVMLGENFFHGKKSHFFGRLTKEEWNNMFVKHLNHHLKQFGV